MRPMLALARLALAKALCVAFMPIAVRTGPFTTIIGALPPVLAVLPCRPNCGSHIAFTTARTTGMYSGRQPAITAAMATFSAVMRRRRTGSTPTSSSGCSPTAARNTRTRSSVGGTTGRPSVHPFCWNSSFAANASSTSWTALANVPSLVIVPLLVRPLTA
jgi:Na+/H+ antiporter NhaD/arsenite permease-like protein